MSDSFPEVDVAIVGAGTSGAAAALLCAERGLKVGCVERGTLAKAGARWVNGVQAAAFDEAGIARPRTPELLAKGVDFHLIAGRGPQRVVIREHELMEVDMRLLVSRLQREAREAGAEFFEETRVLGVQDGVLQTDAGALKSRWIIDASGLAGARLLKYPRPHRKDICAAAQQVHQLRDPDAAHAFCLAHGARAGDTICFSGIEGGYSILNVRVDLVREKRVSILTGSIPARGHRSGRAILREFVDENPWIGEKIFGGARSIPLRRPYSRLYRGNIAALGDAACQVFAAHGSGVGPGMVAAQLLAKSLAAGEGLAGYERAWQRRHGGIFSAHALFRYFTETLDAADLARMMDSGLIDAELIAGGLELRLPKPSPRMVREKIPAVLRAPRLAAKMLPFLGGMGGATALYAGFPRLEPARLAWSKLIQRLLRPQIGR